MEKRTILLVGGGSGGHIFPNVAVCERLAQRGEPVAPHLLVSDRPLDRRLLEHQKLPFSVSPAQPLRLSPVGVLRFVAAQRAATVQARRLIRELNVDAVLATGGFVSAPAVRAARGAGVPAALVNLDARAGKATRMTARHAAAVFSVYPEPRLAGARSLGFPLRRAVTGGGPAAEARRRLDLDPDHDTLLVFAGSQGGAGINRALAALAARSDGPLRGAGGWQVLHLSGKTDRDEVAAAYGRAGVPARVLDFCHDMGAAWAAATLAICRAGAGTVAEAAANRVPAMLLPYPYHRDQHQRANARPLVDAGGALMLEDRIDADLNAEAIAAPLARLLTDGDRRRSMREALERLPVEDGAAVLAQWVAGEAVQPRSGGAAQR